MYLKKVNGFTLVELMIAVAVSLVLLGGIYIAVNSAQKHSTSIERKVTAQRDVKPALDVMAMELSMASYTPIRDGFLWLAIDYEQCTSAIGNEDQQKNRGIQSATQAGISIQMDTTGSVGDGNGLIDDRNEVISYRYIPASQSIIRTTFDPAASTCDSQDFLGSRFSDKRTLRVINGTLGIPVFKYLDGKGNEIQVSGDDLGGKIPDIRRIEIVLAVETEDIDVNTGQRKRLIYSTSVIPRNHAIQN